MNFRRLTGHLYEFGSELAIESNEVTDGNCIAHARMVLKLYNEKIGGEPNLQDAHIQAGAIFELQPSTQSDSSKRFFHALNFLTATQRGKTAVVEVDSHHGNARPVGRGDVLHKMRLAIDGVNTDEAISAEDVIFYGQRRLYLDTQGEPIPGFAGNRTTNPWRSGTTDNLREPPFTVNPEHKQVIALGETYADAALAQLQAGSIGDITDKSKLPVMRLEVRQAAHNLAMFTADLMPQRVQ